MLEFFKFIAHRARNCRRSLFDNLKSFLFFRLRFLLFRLELLLFELNQFLLAFAVLFQFEFGQPLHVGLPLLLLTLQAVNLLVSPHLIEVVLCLLLNQVPLFEHLLVVCWRGNWLVCLHLAQVEATGLTHGDVGLHIVSFGLAGHAADLALQNLHFFEDFKKLRLLFRIHVLVTFAGQVCIQLDQSILVGIVDRAR